MVYFSPSPEFPAPDCSCVNATSLLAQTAPWLLDAPQLEGLCTGFSDISGTCLSDTFGSGSCATWDANTGVGMCSTKTPPQAHCGQPWCFVDSRSCARGSRRTAFRYRGRLVPPNASLSYSYATCGALDLFTRPLDANVGMLRRLQNLTLRASFPLTLGGGTPHFWRLNADGALDAGGTNIAGPIWSMVKSFETIYGVTIQPQHLSSSSLELNNQDSWQACIHEVAINATDICLADVWAFAWRLGYLAPVGTFSTPFAQAHYHLVAQDQAAHTKRETSFWDNLQIPLKPFTPELWACFIGCVILHVSAAG